MSAGKPGLLPRAAGWPRPAPPAAGPWLRLLASELRIVFLRPRNIVLMTALAAAPLFLGFVLWASSPAPGSGGPPFLNQVARNGVFLALFTLFMALPLILPLVVAVVAGDAVAGEAGMGTLRGLLAVPAGRSRLLAVKYLAMAVFAVAACMIIAVIGVAAGAAIFGTGPVTLLSGDTVSLPAGLIRVLFVVLYVTAALTSLGSVGVAISTFTEHALAVTATVLVLAVASQIADAVPQLGWLHPFLPTHWWLSFDALLRTPVGWTDVRHGLLSFGSYAVIAAAVAWARFTTRDVTC